jgi:N-acylneuraminate cytidylyltransferase
VWTIDAAKRANTIDEVVVSTDDAEIMNVAQGAGARVILRPAALATDEASSESALLHTLSELERIDGKKPEQVAFLQCTAPLMRSEDIDGTVMMLEESGADSAFTAAPFHGFLWRKNEKGVRAVNHDSERRARRQDMESQFLEAGSVYAFRAADFEKAGHRFFGKTAFFPIEAHRCLEIDSEADFQRAEAAMRIFGHERMRLFLPKKPAAVIMDFDGVFTDNRVLVREDGMESVTCHRGDGMGLEMLKKTGIPLWVISREKNPVVQARCKKLGLSFLQAVEDKAAALKDWLSQGGLSAQDVIYVGNDVNDLSCMKIVGHPVAVADAHPQALSAAALVLQKNGGAGALRELADLLLEGPQP